MSDNGQRAAPDWPDEGKRQANNKQVLRELSFNDLVQLVREHYWKEEVGYAKAAEMVDKAIQPQINQILQELIDEAEAMKKGVVSYGDYFFYTGSNKSLDQMVAKITQRKLRRKNR